MGLEEKESKILFSLMLVDIDPRQQTSLKLSLTVSKMEIILLHFLRMDYF